MTGVVIGNELGQLSGTEGEGGDKRTALGKGGVIVDEEGRQCTQIQ